ncbi:hypothetical protein QZH41_013488 [Actinostola sp. cb2023]|nr:hypothetical protein QZH41_013488 [Actinostola sp. cb2023]
MNIKYICKDCQGVSSFSLDDRVIRVGKTRPKAYLLNFIALCFILNGQYYKDYEHVLGSLGLIPTCAQQWIKIIDWIAPHVKAIADWCVGEARRRVIERGDQRNLHIEFDGFYLTRGHYSNNSSATIHDQKSGEIIGYAHRSKRGRCSNWNGTSSGAEGDMFSKILESIIDDNFKLDKCTMDQDSSCQEILLSKSPETQVIICGNHRSKTFHSELEKVKKTPCQCKKMKLKCRRMSEAMISNAKKCLSNLTKCEEILHSEDPVGNFAEAILNYHDHYQDIHSSTWCRFHAKETPDGKPYSTKHSFSCPAQLVALKDLLEKMAARADEYITIEGRMTTNVVEGYHSIALMYREKRIDLGPVHYQCKTNMSISIPISQAHRALEDVKAMRKILYQTELRHHMPNIPLRSLREQKAHYSTILYILNL